MRSVVSSSAVYVTLMVCCCALYAQEMPPFQELPVLGTPSVGTAALPPTTELLPPTRLPPVAEPEYIAPATSPMPPLQPSVPSGNGWMPSPPNGSSPFYAPQPAAPAKQASWLNDLNPFADHSGEKPTVPGYYDPYGGQFAYGSAGVQPFRLGWLSYDDMVVMPRSDTTIGGNFQNIEANTWLRYSMLLSNQVLFNWTATWNAKFWTGPTGINFPSDEEQLMSDFQFASAWDSPWNWQVGITPQVNSDFHRGLNSNALMMDARVALIYRPAPEWTFALGTAFWNRATDHLIPYGGVIWAPNDRWELRLMFPKSRISYFLGKYGQSDLWVYGSGEYNLEAYQIDIEGPEITVRGEVSDYRLMLGMNAQRAGWNYFVEGGLVTDRHFRFRGPATDFSVSENFILRAGLTY